MTFVTDFHNSYRYKTFIHNDINHYINISLSFIHPHDIDIAGNTRFPKHPACKQSLFETKRSKPLLPKGYYIVHSLEGRTIITHVDHVRNDRKTSVLTITARENTKREKDTERNAKIDTHVHLDQLQPAGELSTARETAAEIATDDTPATGIASNRQRAIAPYEGGRYVRGYEGRGALGRK